jgi:hypothetical protein
MKFAERYEIQEMVTSGRVSTFLARDRNSQESVVVYTFEVAGTSAAELSTASIISRFSSLAPSPPGIIVKAGFDQASSSAFLTTKMPDPALLNKWVAAYHAFGKATAASTPSMRKPPGAEPSDETAELSAADLRAYLAQNGVQKPVQQPASPADQDSSGEITEIFGPANPATAPTQPQPPGEFTRLFRELNAFEPIRTTKPTVAPPATTATDADLGPRLGGSRLGEQQPTSTPPPVAPVEKESPGAFTREFLGLSSHPAESRPSSTPVDRPVANEPGAFTKEFLGVSSPVSETNTGKVPPAPPASTANPSIFGSGFGSEAAKPSAPTAFESQPPRKESTGEFTRYFQDPFEHPGAQRNMPSVPDLASIEAPKQQPGDFTRMFGTVGTERAPHPVSESEPLPAAPDSFTEIFEKPVPAQGSRLGMSTIGTNPNFQQQFPEPFRTPPPVPIHQPVSPPPVSPASPTPALDELLSSPSARVPESNATFVNRAASNSTNIFNPGADAPPVEQDVPKGPSEFTMFLNRSQVNTMLRQGPGAPAPNPAGGQAAPPPVPNPFMMPPPPPPAPPPMAAPATPAIPAVPRPPASAAVAAPKANTLWPLITGLTVLLAIGVILVMYFVLKH